MVNLTQVCQFLRNWFVRDVVKGSFSVQNGELVGDVDLLNGQYYRIRKSVLNDGVHKHGEETLADEPEFSGEIWLMSVPPDLVLLLGEINEWTEATAKIAAKPYQSESFQGYSYSLKSDAMDWQNHFYAKLAPWRKI